MDQPSPHPQATTQASSSANNGPARTKKSHRGGKKKRSRRKSFVAEPEDMPEDGVSQPSVNAARETFYSLHGRNMSNTSIDSEALLDHR